ncbi:MAG: dihydroorotase [Clostridia bacterium]|nr:dihydroorotase [Clostridia bacterium]
MKVLFRNAKVYENGTVRIKDMLLTDSSLSVFSGTSIPSDASVVDNTVILPGFCDVHVHFREPGFSYKETIKSGSLAAAHGGYTSVLTMPNLSPTPDSRENLEAQLDIIRRDALISVIPYGTITVGEQGVTLADLEGMASDVCGFSDDGKGVQSDAIMLEAMRRAKALGKPIAAHCEVNSLLNGGYIHDGEYARAHGHRGISSASEYEQIKRDIELVRETGVDYHVCHISTKESVEAIREAKREDVNITCETGPHYILLDDSALEEDGRFKMNPPLRSLADREAILEGIIDGTIDMIATDHAPHSAEEKSRGLEKSMMGVVGLESCFPLLYTYLVKPGIISLERLTELMSVNPRKRFGITEDPGFTVFEVEDEYEINPEDFLSKGRSTPFSGVRVFGKCLVTVYGGRTVYTDKK